MLALLDLLPVIIFVAAYRLYGIYEATAALIVSMILVIIAHWLIKGMVSRMLLISGAFAVGLGGITIWLQDPVFLQWKPTIVYGIFAAILLGVDLFSDRNVFARTMGDNIEMSRSSWRTLNLVWVIMLVAMGIINIYVAYNYEMSIWVDFKLYLAIASMVLGFAVTALFLFRHMPEEPSSDGESVSKSAADSDTSGQ